MSRLFLVYEQQTTQQKKNIRKRKRTGTNIIAIYKTVNK